ncbi:MAG: NAD(P)-binding domain-containing protein [Acidobacteria bacterium]|nr:NAD(P)-binding domain-containing protein [Acidobacteriota bacterium]MBV9144419.1 NAD(P)-binding domain-containing protein [Acidobacteriota bacterium]MBV9434986.1 NAD(P)-binding domain-containing protein [Acidobacteriota bacterium]
MDTYVTFGVAAILTLFFLLRYVSRMKRREAAARAAVARGELFSDGPRSQHPHINTSGCIGCGACTQVCPEGDVLAMLGGKAAVVNGHKCIGHSLCAEACPVGAITMVRASASMEADMPALSPQYETNIHNLFVVGELGGLALIKNAINQGRECIDTVAARIKGNGRRIRDAYDVVIVGAGPGGISASLRAIEHKLNYITLEQDEVGGTIAKFPRQKLVLTSPVELPLYGKMTKRELSKENLLAIWQKVLSRADFKVRAGEKVNEITKDNDGVFEIVTPKGQYRAQVVVLALGRAGTPRKLGVKGEDLPKVMYRLIEADHYKNKKIVVVGGGDSAVEAAMGLAHQQGNQVTLSYRKECFSRIKDRNMRRVQQCMANGKMQVIFNSVPAEFKERSVVLEVNGSLQEIPNDYVWIFAGGVPPSDFLRRIGIQLGTRDITLEAAKEARQEALFRGQLVEV